ncbi:TRAP transporter substrate-binding protein [Paenibacillus abyssi]|uniref:ABC transporter substrate-binding protein n=1 Tax=Paenibacillus abyssi TaxID=1340531 RepID=A0A917G210_9BACL|nr:DctP family TRAP transporter solute-binding subunit [Paenibacillus abyssi]GGG19113.1 ABC transporter substrate-binding protein [Paenibacillus abyssi]
MFNRRLITVTTAMVMVLVLIGCSASGSSGGGSGASGSSESYTIKLGHLLAPDSHWNQGAEKFKEIVEENSEGRLKVEIYHSAQLGGERQVIESVQNNIVQMVITGGTYGVIDERYLVLELPFVFKDPQDAYDKLDGELGDTLFSFLPERNLKGLAYWENGSRYITNSKHPIVTPDDLKDLKIRVPENKASLKTFEVLGANVTPMGFAELFQALEGRVVDGQENPVPNIHSSKFYEVQKYLSLTGHQYSPSPVMISSKFYDSLPDDLKTVIEEAAIEARDFQREVSQENQAKLLEDLTAEGMEITEVDQEAFRAKVEEVYTYFEPTIGKELIDMVRK